LIFTAVNKLILEEPPVGDPATLLNLYPTYDHGQGYGKFTPQIYDNLVGQAKSFSGIAAYDLVLPGTIGGSREPERVWGESVTVNYFEVAALPFTLGRGFLRSETRSPVVVLGNGLWRRHFNQDPGIVGKTVSLSGKMFTVVGVTKPRFRGINRLFDAEFWVPQDERRQLSGSALDEMEMQPPGGQLDVIARLQPGVTRKQAQTELDVLANRFAAAYPKEEHGLGFHVEQAGDLLPSQRAMFARFLTALTVVALLVLSIACSNIANLLLVRAAARHGEMAVRIALGATRLQLIRPLLLESVLLALGGGVFGVVLCLAGLGGLTALHLPSPLPIDLTLNLDWRVLLYAFLLSVGAGFLCGVGPAFVAARPVLPSSLKGEKALDRRGRRWSARSVLVVVQISMCVVLLSTTGLFLRSMVKSSEADPGFQTRGVLMLSIDPAHNGYTAEQTPLLLRRLQGRVVKLPGVLAAAWTDKAPASLYGQGAEFHETGSKANPENEPSEIYDVGGGYFRTMGITWLAGQTFDDSDSNARQQLVVNEAFARKLFGGRNAVGEHVTSAGETYEIVGVVRNTLTTTVNQIDEPIVYRALNQNMATAAPYMGFSLMVRYAGDSAELALAARREIGGLDPALAVFDEQTMEEHLSDALILPRTAAAIFGVFGFAGLLLASVGLYGVMSYAVSSRTREIGIRLALGATHRGVRRMIVGQGMTLSALAVAVGLPAALAASKIAARVLYGIAPHDWVTFTVVPCFLACVALATCWFPARRAAAIEPQAALRHE
jgi:predicted permease